jgi:hydrogenase maturation protease
MRNKIVLIGLGNILLRDEGLGVHAVEALRKNFDFPPEVQLLDGGTLGLDLLPLIEGAEKLLFIDAVDSRQSPGAIIAIGEKDLPVVLEPKLSVHHVGLSDLLFAATLQGSKPAEVALLGMQPEKMEVGLTLSATVAGNFEKLLQAILEKLRQWGVQGKEKTTGEPSHVPGHSI